MLAKIREYLEKIVIVFTLIQNVGETIVAHPRITCSLVGFALLYSSLYWSAFLHPANTIHSFYSAINAKGVDPKKLNDAWNLLNPEYRRQRWNDDFNNFGEGFKTTLAHDDVNVQFDAPTWNPGKLMATLFAPSLGYDVSFVARDRFTKQDCEREEHEYDCLWLPIQSRSEYKDLMKGTLRAPEGTATPSLELVRYYKKKFIIHRLSVLSWSITGIRTYEEGIKR